MRRDAVIDRPLSSLAASRGGAVAVLFALMLIPLLLGVGVAVDFGRLAMLKASLQTVADGAALAGASVLNQSNGASNATTVAAAYFTKGAASLAGTAVVGSPSVTEPSSIEVQVTATATLSLTLMSLVTNSMQVSVLAAADGPGYVLQVTKTGGFKSDASDSNSVYYYIINSNGTVPTSTSQATLMFTNDPKVDPNYTADNASPKGILVGPNDQVGFGLLNITGGITSYPKNAYGAGSGSAHPFYSSIAVPSANAYSSQGTFYTGKSTTYKGNTTCTSTAITAATTSWQSNKPNACNAHPCVTASGKALLNNNLLINGACSTQATAIQTCLQLYNNPVEYRWNDMGGSPDDFDYDDADYTVSCQPNTTGTGNSNQPANVTLVR
jgi:Flp pilus assembly protein TadG